MRYRTANAVCGSDLSRLAISATNHCLIGCAIGELAGMIIAISLGWSDLPSIALAVGLAYLFGFSLTARPLVKAELAVGVVISAALAADTLSITIMEVIDNVFVVLIPSALEAGIDDPLIYASVAGGFVLGYPVTFLANRYMIARGRGHALVHEHQHRGGRGEESFLQEDEAVVPRGGLQPSDDLPGGHGMGDSPQADQSGPDEREHVSHRPPLPPALSRAAPGSGPCSPGSP